jgi:hypothetical protein
MRTLTAFLNAVLTVGTVTVSVQQPPPNLNGTWVATKDTPATVAVAPSAVFGERFGLRPEGKNMALIRPIRGGATALTNVFPVVARGGDDCVRIPVHPGTRRHPRLHGDAQRGPGDRLHVDED